MRENAIEKEFVKAVREAGGIAYKLTSQTANGLPSAEKAGLSCPLH